MNCKIQAIIVMETIGVSWSGVGNGKDEWALDSCAIIRAWCLFCRGGATSRRPLHCIYIQTIWLGKHGQMWVICGCWWIGWSDVTWRDATRRRGMWRAPAGAVLLRGSQLSFTDQMSRLPSLSASTGCL